MTRANAAIGFDADSFDSSQSKLLGRLVANETFLRGFLQHAEVDAPVVACRSDQQFQAFVQFARHATGKQDLACLQVREQDQAGLARVGTYYQPSPSIVQQAWLRRYSDQRGYSLCGVTHTVSGEMMETIAGYVQAPLQSWDALVCTSVAVRQAVQAACGELADYLADRLGAAPAPLAVQLPVIPLGVDSSLFLDGSARTEARARRRRSLGIAEDDCVFLFVGRLSFHAKANPSGMYQALESTARRTGKRLHLIHYGWFATSPIESAFREAVAALAPSVTCHFVEERGATAISDRSIWCAADVFTSMSDNIQESFGITPVEAMAAGLPAVVSDWDGYRDTVRDGVDGFTVPTASPPPGMGVDVAHCFEAGALDYDLYVGNVSLTTAVDVEACARAYAQLVADPQLRRRMGDSGLRRARQDYDWRAIVPRYQALWEELGVLRREARESAPRRPGRSANPFFPDPYRAFAGHPTMVLGDSDRLESAVADLDEAFERVATLKMNAYGYAAIGREPARRRVLALLKERQPCTAGDLLADLPDGEGRAMALRIVLWLAKLGLVRIIRPARATPSDFRR